MFVNVDGAQGVKFTGQVNDQNEPINGIVEYNNAVYNGTLKNYMRNGYGRIDYANGNYYEGRFKDTAFYGNGTRKLGNFVYDLYYVWNKIFTVNGQRFSYTGQVCAQCNLPNGFGSSEHLATQEKYKGYWFDGKYDDFGQLTFKNGSFYEGNFDDGYYSDSSGYFCFKQNSCISGMFNRGGPLLGEWKGPNFSYTGLFSDFKPAGLGKYTFASGDRYEGLFLNGVSHTSNLLKSKYFSFNGDVYEGSYINGLPVGTHSVTYSDGTTGKVQGIPNNNNGWNWVACTTC